MHAYRNIAAQLEGQALGTPVLLAFDTSLPFLTYLAMEAEEPDIERIKVDPIQTIKHTLLHLCVAPDWIDFL